jgi:hypothetical protein
MTSIYPVWINLVAASPRVASVAYLSPHRNGTYVHEQCIGRFFRHKVPTVGQNTAAKIDGNRCMVVRGASGVAYSAPRAGTGIRACVGPSHVLCNRFRNRPIIGKASPQSARSRVSIDVGVNRDCFALARPLIEHPGQVRAFARFLFARPESVRSFVVSLKKCMSGIDTNSHRVPATYRDSPIAISQSIGRFSSIFSKIDAVTDELRPGSRSYSLKVHINETHRL